VAKQILDEDHYELKKVKDRILDYLSVRELKARHGRGDLVLRRASRRGQNQVWARSIARALGRKFSARLAGRQARRAEIRGHRRTYIGARPARSSRAFAAPNQRPGGSCSTRWTSWPRTSAAHSGLGAAGTLDPEAEQTRSADNYLDVQFIMSKRDCFICTANIADTVPPPLIDRMEIISAPGLQRGGGSCISRTVI